ncbi:ribosome assembly RNA-binding protein YhbY [Pseudoduganella sp.]|uniref:ribosome assembly RNA-binding protein YhbY n=1 Tax=Pseudoduganella sp. TaxID=1880898 RepID=UPI0035B2F896
MLNLTPAERSVLRAEAHGLKPIVMVGESGLTPSVMKEIELGLDSHGLIKVRVFGDDREARIEMYETICEKTGAAPVQHIGKLLVLYRPKVDAEKSGSSKAGKGMRMVTIVKPSASGTKKPTVKKVLLKGNERVTAGGTIKRVKKKVGTKKSVA